MQHVDPDQPITDPCPLAFGEPWSYELHFPRDPRGPAIARTTLKAVLSAHGLGDLIDRAELLTSELTSNAVRYSEGPATVRLRWENPVLRVSVTDTCPDLPVRQRTIGPDAVRGRGLLILDLFADAWGGCGIGEALFGVGGKSVWFELVFGDGPPFPSTTALAA
ncbi:MULTISPECIES: ATP-binding protein [unclassified Streptomyces]|uniref:ATP-binding protein n=1 Tax=unclassified Streptomyces TaxID=2593676 RepID=UPI0022B6EBD6|nr:MULTISPECIES: ATP-binding protein [unclassified Streptomyces]MCZ7415029.1 ATP-binding protein [Streptomyces sp. WMMC897]MCZ7431972.1 ATP-binding protein [Streptomyces sp. WMMC1477]